MINLPNTHKVALLFTGGMESHLLARILIERYGIENVVLVLMIMDEYNVFKANPEKAQRVLNGFDAATKRLNVTHTLAINSEMLNKHHGTIPQKVLSSIKEVFPDIEYTFDGYNNIHKESMDIFRETNFDHTIKHDVDRVRMHLATHQEEYPELYDFVFKCDGMIYFVQDDYTLKTREDVIGENISTHLSPLMNYTKADVIKLYAELNLLDELYKTKSCNTSTAHCGKCKNCLNRKFAFKQSGIEDKTEYLS